MLTAYSFPFVNLLLTEMPKDFILFALCLWETCSWRDCTPEILGAAGWELYFGCVLPHGVLMYLPTLLWVFSAQLAASLLCITTLLAVTTETPAEIQHDDPENILLWKDIEVLKTGTYHSLPPFSFTPKDPRLLTPIKKKEIYFVHKCVWHCSLHMVTGVC